MKNADHKVSSAVDAEVLKSIQREASNFVAQLIYDVVEVPTTLTLKHVIDWEIEVRHKERWSQW